jgi:hypothetical protein
MPVVKLREYKPQQKTQQYIDLILELVAKYHIPVTVRQVHYLLVGTKEVNHPNTIRGYQKVSRILTDMRYGGRLDWDKIVDQSRDVYKQKSYNDISEAINMLLARYRRDRWQGSNYYVEVWVEKRTLVNQFYPITDKADVYLASGGGFSSATYVYEAQERLKAQQDMGKQIVVLYFGDLDSSGEFMSEDIEKRFEEWGIDLLVKRVCLNDEHLHQYKLPVTFDVPVRSGDQIVNKLERDPRAKRFAEKHDGKLFQVELEALDPAILTQMLVTTLSKYIDVENEKRIRQKEQSETNRIRRRLGLKRADM